MVSLENFHKERNLASASPRNGINCRKGPVRPGGLIPVEKESKDSFVTDAARG